jgi:hypothetical protein
LEKIDLMAKVKGDTGTVFIGSGRLGNQWWREKKLLTAIGLD